MFPPLFGRPGIKQFNYDFGSPPEEEENLFMPQPQMMAPEPPSFMKAYEELINRREGPAMSAYKNFISETPDPEEYKPGKVTRLGAILSGMAAGFVRPGSGASVAQSILDRPYELAVRRRNITGDNLREAASLEETQGKNKLAQVDMLRKAENEQADNLRAQKAQEILNRSRELGMKKTQAELELIGIKTQVDPSTGHLMGVHLPTGKVTDYGKVGLSTDDRVGEDKIKRTNAGVISSETFKRNRLFDVPILQQLDSFRTSNDIRAGKELEADREVNREKGRKETEQNIRTRPVKEPKVDPEIKASREFRNNKERVRALVAAEPKLKDFFKPDTDEMADRPELNTVDYFNWVKVYNALYKGIKEPLSEKPASGGSKFKIERE